MSAVLNINMVPLITYYPLIKYVDAAIVRRLQKESAGIKALQQRR